MKKLILASVSAIALFGVAACSDTDGTTTQSVEPAETTTVPTDPATPAPQAAPADEAPADSMTPAPAPAPAQ